VSLEPLEVPRWRSSAERVDCEGPHPRCEQQAADTQRKILSHVADVPTIVYDLALRSLDQQERELGELRARTNTVVAAAALIASFLGAAAIREHGGLSVLSVVALAVLAITGWLSLVVLWPRELSFAFDARVTYSQLHPLLEKVSEAQLRIAYAARDRYRSNKETIDGLELAFQGAVLTLGLQTILWATALAVA
jgi:hypothetical protein